MTRRSSTTLRRILLSTLFISFLSGIWFVLIFHLKYSKLASQDVSSELYGWEPIESIVLGTNNNHQQYDDVDENLVGPSSFIRGGVTHDVSEEDDAISDTNSDNAEDENSNSVINEKVEITSSTSSTKSTEVTPAKHGQDTDRLYCMVPFIWTPKYLPSYHAIQATWGKRCHILRFMIDPIIGDSEVGYYNMTLASDVIAASKHDNLRLPNDVVVLHDMKRPWHNCPKSHAEDGSCRNIWEKIWRAWVYVVTGKGGSLVGTDDDNIANNVTVNTDAYKAEWFVKVDADTWLFPENLSRYVQSRNWSYTQQHYFGHVLNHRIEDRGVSIVAGAAVFFSRATLLAAADSFQKMSMENGNQEEDGTCRDAYTGTEEVVTAVCLKEHSNIIADPAIDPNGREFITLGPVDGDITYNRTAHGEWWFWEGKKRFPCHDDGDCIAYLPLAFHGYKEPDVFFDFEKEFYGSVMKGEEDDSLAERNDNKIAARNWDNFDETHEYFERVRAAMKAAALKENGEGMQVSKTEPTTAPQTNRLYCMVPFIWSQKYLPSYEVIRNTWGKRCDVLKFFIDPIIEEEKGNFIDLRSRNGTNFVVPEDVVVVYYMHRPWHKCPSNEEGDCRNIWEKIWRSWLWIDDNGDSDLASWFVKVDYDTYLFPDNVKKYVEEKHWSPDDHHYFGHKLRHTERRKLPPIIAGSASFFSRATVKGAAKIFRKFKFEKDNNSVRRCKDSCKSSPHCIVRFVALLENSQFSSLQTLAPRRY